MIIYIDTREQQELWCEEQSTTEFIFIKKKLDEGDYTSHLLENSFCCERKSPEDLYGSILKNHERFKREILRAKEKNKEFHIFVECTKTHFISMRWNHNAILRANPRTLAAIINTMENKHNIVFHWCDNRNDMRARILYWLNIKENTLNNNYINKQNK